MRVYLSLTLNNYSISRLVIKKWINMNFMIMMVFKKQLNNCIKLFKLQKLIININKLK